VETARQIADPQVRSKGTIGGDIAHGDPGNDHPAVMLALGALVGNRWRLLSRINIADYGAASLVGLGLFWFVSRGFVSG